MTKIIAFAGRKQSGKNTCSNFLHGMEMTALELIDYFKINEETNGKLLVPMVLNDEYGEGIFDLENKSHEMVSYLNERVWPWIKAYSFADNLKQKVCIDVLGLSWEQCYGTDEQKNSLTHLKWEDMPGVITTDRLFSFDGYETSGGFGLMEDFSDIDIKNDTQIYNKLKEEPEYFNNYKCMNDEFIFHTAGIMTTREVMQHVGTDIFRRMYPNVWIDSTLKKIEKEGPALAIITDCRFVNEAEAIKKVGGIVVKLTRQVGDGDTHKSESEIDQYDEYDIVIENHDMTIAQQNEALFTLLCEMEDLHYDISMVNKVKV